MLRLQPPFAGADERYEDANASSYHRSRPKTQSVGSNVVDLNFIAFFIVFPVAIVYVAAAVSAAVVEGAAVVVNVLLVDRIYALISVYASTWLVAVPQWATSTLNESVPTPDRV